MSKTDKISLDLSGHSYDIIIGAGILAQAETYIAPLLHRPQVAIVTDENLAATHLQTLVQCLEKAGITAMCKSLPAGEATKNFTQLQTLLGWLLDQKIERQDIIIALGGGVIGDLVGFAASILRRGTRFIQIPTSLLAQVDSSVGGKTAINVGQGKNLIGSFYQPDLVLADSAVLKSLPARQFAAGYAEVVKYGVLGNRDFFTWLTQNRQSIFAHETDALMFAIKTSCQMKADIVKRDERENNIRALLNLGHTFGHALEAATGYGTKLLHGEAVAVGMAQALRLSAHLGFAKPDDAVQLSAHLHASGLPVKLADIDQSFTADDLIAHMQQDKKVQAGKMKFILARGIGDAFISDDVDPETLKEFLVAEGAEGINGD